MKTYKLDNIEISEDQIRKLIKDHPELIEKKSGKPWRAEKGEYHYIVDSCGYVCEEYEDGDIADDYHYLTGNYFATKEEAEACKARQEAIGRVTHKILELNDGDYKDSNNRYWAILARNNNLMPSSTPMGEYYAITLPYIASREIAEQIIKDHEADLKIIFNIK